MTAHTAVPFVDTNIIPDRNAGIGSLLWDLQHPLDPDRDGPPLLDAAFAFIDVGVSRAKVSTALKTLLARDLGMDVEYVATERPEAVPYAYVTLSGERAQKIHQCLSRMISSAQATREIKDWHLVIDGTGTVSSVAYAYDLHGNEAWESYFMGRPFLYSGETVRFSDPQLDELLASHARWDDAQVERNPLETRLEEFGIRLQRTDVPQRINGRQNVLFLGNVLNHYRHEDQAGALERMAANMKPGDIVIIQADETETPSIDVLQVTGDGARERVRSINTRTLEVQERVGPESWRRIPLRAAVDRMADGLVECLRLNATSAQWNRDAHNLLVRQRVTHVFRTFFRALPVEHTLRPAIRDAVRRVRVAGSA